MIIMNFAPIGVFCLIASTFATTGWDAFIPLLKYMGAVLLALFIQASGTSARAGIIAFTVCDPQPA